METRRLGTRGPEVTALGLGCMGLSDFYAFQGGDDEGMRVILHALERGVRFLDTSDMYGPHTNEKLVGRALRNAPVDRDDVIVATKFGVVRGDDGSFLGVNGRPEYVRESCLASLRRLGTDHIDLYYQHRIDPDVPVEDTVGEMARLAEEGKVRWLGLSEAAPATIRRAHAEAPLTALQTEYSLWSRDPEDGILDTVRELGIGFVAYSPLGRGFLTGRFQEPEDLPENDYRRHHPRFQGENFRKNLELAEEVEAMAGAKGVTPAQLALAWVLSRGDDVVPIPGTTSTEHLDENLGALDVTLTDDDLARLDEIAPPGVTAGPRYPDMSTVNR